MSETQGPTQGSPQGSRDKSTQGKSGPVLPPAARAENARKAAELERQRRARAADAPNPTWWAPVFVTLLLAGLVWIVVFYISQGLWPVAAFGYWNLVLGFALLIGGFAMTMKWK